MSLRDKARDIKAAGEKQRGNFQPEEGSAPLRLYQYWADNTNPKRVPERENFCHYWRVVAIWAPLLFIRKKFFAVSDAIGGWRGTPYVIALLYIGAAVSLFFFPIWYVGALLIGVPLAFLGGVSGFVYANIHDEIEDADEMDNWFRAFAVLGLPATVLVYLFRRLYNNWDDDWTAPALIGVLGTAAVALVGIMLWEYIQAFRDHGFGTVMKWTGVALGACAALVAVAFSMIKGAEWLKAWMTLRDEKRDEERAEFRRKVEAGEAEWPEETPFEWPRWLVWIADKIAAFFKGIVDFLVLIAQVLRVNKWKICPTVAVPETARQRKLREEREAWAADPW